MIRNNRAIKPDNVLIEPNMTSVNTPLVIFNFFIFYFLMVKVLGKHNKKKT